MVQFLSINFFFLDFFNFCWVFQKFPFFVSICIKGVHSIKVGCCDLGREVGYGVKLGIFLFGNAFFFPLSLSLPVVAQ